MSVKDGTITIRQLSSYHVSQLSWNQLLLLCLISFLLVTNRQSSRRWFAVDWLRHFDCPCQHHHSLKGILFGVYQLLIQTQLFPAFAITIDHKVILLRIIYEYPPKMSSNKNQKKGSTNVQKVQVNSEFQPIDFDKRRSSNIKWVKMIFGNSA
jgi:hypothetical protein